MAKTMTFLSGTSQQSYGSLKMRIAMAKSFLIEYYLLVVKFL